MSRGEMRQSGWQGACLVAITYVYFLIFAQFAFLKRLADLGVADTHLKAVMATMAMGGILFSLLAPRVSRWPSPNLRLRAGLFASGNAAFASLLPMTLAAAMAVSFLIGAGLGLLTVTLVTHLRMWTGSRHPLLLVGIGTGAGYLVCNLPVLFTASAEGQTTVAGVLCLAGIAITFYSLAAQQEEVEAPRTATLPFRRVLACFTALVWLDSAAFFIIQNTAVLKAGTWNGRFHLAANGLLHLGAALSCVWLLRRRGLSLVLTSAFLALGSACLLLLHPGRALAASVLYPIGVSIYSVALVAYPSLLSSAASIAERGPPGWMALCHSGLGWIGAGHRNGPEPGSRSTAVCAGGGGSGFAALAAEISCATKTRTSVDRCRASSGAHSGSGHPGKQHCASTLAD